MKPISFNAILGRVATKSDGSLALNFSTGEMSSEETTVLIKLCRINLRLLLTPLGLTAEPPVEVKSELNEKSPGHRLRSVLFVQWKHLTELKSCEVGFEPFYRDAIESFINIVKDKLPEQV